MKIEFDPAKDCTNAAKHGVSLRAADGFDWAAALEREDDRFDYGKIRFVALGLIVCPCSCLPKALTKMRCVPSACAPPKSTR